MRSSVSILLLFALVLAAIAVVADDGQGNARRLVDEGAILPLEEILQAVRRQQPGKLLEAELETEGGELVYEIELLGPDGVVWELKVDAATGRILDRELED